MSKRKRTSKKRERIPVIDTLIDLAGAATLDYLAAKRRQKYGSKRGNKIDPYEATGIAMGLGMINDTEDIIKLGGVLGAMGAFDDDKDLPINTAAYMAPRDNRYAWRLNCEDGSAYGIAPEDYETRDEYNDALRREKYAWRDFCEDGTDYGISPDDYETEEEYDEALEEARNLSDNPEENLCRDVDNPVLSAQPMVDNVMDCSFSGIPQEPIPTESADPYADDDFHVYVYCLVELIGTGGRQYYRTEDRTLKKGEAVFVPDVLSGAKQEGIIRLVEHHMRFSVPQPVDKTPEIIGRV